MEIRHGSIRQLELVVTVLDPVVREGLSKGDTEMGSVICFQQMKGNEFSR